MSKEEVFITTVFCLIIGIPLAVLIFFNPIRFVGAGERGVVLNWGAVSGQVLPEGMHFIVPWKQSVKKMNVRTVKTETDVVSYSKDIQTVNAKIALNYHLNPDGVNRLYQEIGLNYQDTLIAPAIQESVKAATSKFTAQELVDQRPKVKDEITAILKERLLKWSITIDELSIANFDFSDEYEKAVERKQVAQQEALKAENDLKRVKTEAEQRVAQAEAEAKAIRVQSESANNEKYIQLKAIEAQIKAIEKWNGVLPTQMIPNASLPFVNLTK